MKIRPRKLLKCLRLLFESCCLCRDHSKSSRVYVGVPCDYSKSSRDHVHVPCFTDENNFSRLITKI